MSSSHLSRLASRVYRLVPLGLCGGAAFLVFLGVTGFVARVTPTLGFFPDGGTYTQARLSVDVESCDSRPLSTSGTWIKLNGVDVTSSFNLPTDQAYTCSSGGVDIIGTITLSSGTNTLSVHICNDLGSCTNASDDYTYNATPVLDHVTLSISTNPVNDDDAEMITGTAIDTQGHSMPGETVTLSSSNASVLTFDGSGNVVFHGPGTTTITATDGSKTASQSLTVNAGDPNTVSVSLTSGSIEIGATTTATAIVQDITGYTLPSPSITWSTSNSSVAYTSGSGSSVTVHGAGAGSATITATAASASNGASLDVYDASPVVSITPSGYVNHTTGVAADVNGCSSYGHAYSSFAITLNGVDVTSQFSATNPTYFACGSGGTDIVASNLTLQSGSNTLYARVCDNYSDCGEQTVYLTTYTSNVDHINVTPATVSLEDCNTQQLTATAYDQHSTAMTGESFSWSTRNSSVATVSSSGMATATGPGTTYIVASDGGHTDSAQVTVSLGAPSSISLASTGDTMDISGLDSLQATVKECGGHTVSGQTIDWTHSGSAFTSLSPTSGTLNTVVTGVHSGRDSVTATLHSNGSVKAWRIIVIATGTPHGIATLPDSVSVQKDSSVVVRDSVWDVSGYPTTRGAITWNIPSSVATITSHTDSSATVLAGNGTGNTIIIATTANGYADTTKIVVTQSCTCSCGTCPTSKLVVASRLFNPDSVIARDHCLTVAAGDAGAYECGDLRLAHVLPGVTTYGVTRAPMLVYNSRTASLKTALAATVNLQLASGGTAPTSLEATVSIGGTPVIRDTVAWSSTCLPTICRITVPLDGSTFPGSGTGVFPYVLDVKTIGGTALTGSDTGVVILVDRQTSAFGNGWWLDGLEQISYTNTDSTNFLWVGGDGSARIYAKQSSTVWVATNVDHPDSLIKVDTVYRRELPNQGYVEFDQFGRHIRTVNRLGHVATFSYDSNNYHPRTIAVPVPSGTTAPTYTFHYSTIGSHTQLTSVDAPAVNGSSRTTTIGVTAAATDTSITDPDTTTVRFRYGPDTLVRINRLGDSTTYVFDGAGTLAETRISMSRTGGSPIVTDYCAGETAGINTCSAGLIPTDSAYTYVNGPRQNVNTLKAVLNRYGAPTRITDALGNSTVLTYDRAWPGLVSEVDDPLGHIVDAYYNGRANPDSVADVNGFASRATTRYEYQAGTDWLTKITGPAGAYTTFTVDTTNGNRLTAANGSADSTTETFSYYTSTVGAGLLHTSAWPDGATTTFAYDALGNVDTVQTPRGSHTYSVRDAIGRAVVVRTQIDSAGAHFRRDSTVYDVASRPVLAEAINGISTQRSETHYFYDNAGRDTATTISSIPDPNSIGTDTTRTHYDALGRVVARLAADGNQDSVVFDPAGNPITQITRLGGTAQPITMVYDAMNRLLSRSVPAYVYSADNNGLGHGGTQAWKHSYPLYPNVSGQTGYTVAAQVDTFAYDAAGRMTLANNGDAHVSRAYYANGLLESETQRLRTLADTSEGGDFTHHVYTVSYQYDLAGRTTGITVPEQLAPRIQPDSLGTVLLLTGSTRQIEDQIGYTYDTGTSSTSTGRLTGVTGLLPSETFTYGYTPRGEVATMSGMTMPAPDGPSTRPIADRRRYDLDGALRAQTVLAGSTGGDTLRAETFGVDAGGRVLSDSDASHYGALMPTAITYTYSGLGQVVSSLYATTSGDGFTALQAEETMSYDAIGNWTARTNTGASEFGAAGGSGYQYANGSGAARYAAATGRVRAQTFDAGRRDTLEYDAAGNLHAMLMTNAGDTAQYNERVSYYGVDGRLAAADARNVAFGSTALAGHVAFEAYRYDALGRRVLARVRRWCDDDTGTSEGGDGTPCEIAAIRRTVWNGTSELAEIQMPADDSTPPDTVENDTLAVQRHWEQMSAHPLYDANRLYGRVLYVPGLVTDQPLFITRVNYADASDVTGGAATYGVYAPFSIVPLWNAQGRVDRAVIGGTAAPGADALCVGASARCAEIAFDRGIYPYARSGSDPGSWQGTVLVDKPDATGTYYRRNRSYDPSLARFTQEDPIGLGGGLNLYGFANGDPVNTADPFGLCPIEKDGIPCTVTMGVRGAVAGTVVGAIGGATAGTFVEPGGGTVFVGAGVAIVGGAAGFAGGSLAGAARDLTSIVEMSGLGTKIRNLLTGILIGKGGGLSKEQEIIRRGGAKPAVEETVPIPKKSKKSEDPSPDKDPLDNNL